VHLTRYEPLFDQLSVQLFVVVHRFANQKLLVVELNCRDNEQHVAGVAGPMLSAALWAAWWDPSGIVIVYKGLAAHLVVATDHQQYRDARSAERPAQTVHDPKTHLT